MPVLSAAGLYEGGAGEQAEVGPFLGVIDAIVETDRTIPVKQRHTAMRIFERLRDEHGLRGGHRVVKDRVRLSRGFPPVTAVYRRLMISRSIPTVSEDGKDGSVHERDNGHEFGWTAAA